MEIQPAGSGDYDAYVRLVCELGVSDPTPSRDVFERALRPRMVVASEAGQVLGYALTETLHDVGYVRNLVSAPLHRRRGVGRALMAHVRAVLLASGARAWCLNVRPDNTPAVRLYESLGLSLAHASDALRVNAGSEPWPLSHRLELTHSSENDDAALEARFSLLPGQLAAARSRANCQVLEAHADGECIGVMAFDAAFAGAFPFRVLRPELGPFVFEALRRRAHPEAGFMQVVVEGNLALRDVLLARGAHVAMHFVHMRGALTAKSE